MQLTRQPGSGETGGDFLEGCTCWDQSHSLPHTCLSLCCCILYLQTICKQLKRGDLGVRDMRMLPETHFTCPSEMLNKVLGGKDQDWKWGQALASFPYNRNSSPTFALHQNHKYIRSKHNVEVYFDETPRVDSGGWRTDSCKVTSAKSALCIGNGAVSCCLMRYPFLRTNLRPVTFDSQRGTVVMGSSSLHFLNDRHCLQC